MTSAPLPPRPLRWARTVAVCLLALALGGTLAACGGDKPAADDDGPSSQQTAGGTRLAAVWPLTGLPADDDAPAHPVLVTKIDNTSSSRPQVGLSSADLVAEELVEGGITRLAVFFYSKLPEVVGPVRSMRASDIGVVKPARGVLVASGAAPPTLGRLNHAKVTYYTEGGPGYYRAGDRSSPYNLMVRMPELAKAVKKKAGPPGSYLPWGAESDVPGGKKARSVQAIFSRAHTTSWKYQGGKYVNLNSNAAADDQFEPDTVLVVRVKQGVANYRDPAGNPVPVTIYRGKGKMLMFHGGKVVRGTWEKDGEEGAVRFTTKDGELKVPPGHVWLELVPVASKGGNVTWSKN